MLYRSGGSLLSHKPDGPSDESDARHVGSSPPYSDCHSCVTYTEGPFFIGTMLGPGGRVRIRVGVRVRIIVGIRVNVRVTTRIFVSIRVVVGIEIRVTTWM